MAREGKLRFCVIGCGNVALKYGIDAIINSGVSEVVVCVDHGISKKKLIKEKFNLPFELNFSDALQNFDFDAVYISTPTGLHKEIAVEAAENGKHILCEKSLASNFADAEKMLNSAKENEVAIFEGFMYQFHSQHTFVKKLLNENKIGKVFHINAWFGFPRRPDNDFRYNNQKGGGALLDAGAYTLHFARNFFETTVKKVNAVLNIEDGVNLRGNILLSFTENKTAQLSFAMNSFYKNKYELWGENGIIRVERAFSVTPDYEPIIIVETESGVEKIELKPDNHFVNEIRYFVENYSIASIRKKWNKEAYDQAALVEKVIESDRNFREVI